MSVDFFFKHDEKVTRGEQERVELGNEEKEVKQTQEVRNEC